MRSTNPPRKAEEPAGSSPRASHPGDKPSAATGERHIETPAAAKGVEIFPPRKRSEKNPAAEGGAERILRTLSLDDMLDQWRTLDRRIAALGDEFADTARNDPAARRLATIPVSAC